MSEGLQPYFWIRRNGDTYVPLIPADELPTWLELKGISATKDWNQVCQGEMRFLGDHYDHNGNHYAVEILDTRDIATDQANGLESDSSSFAPMKKNLNVGGASSGIDQIQANIDKITSAQDESLEDSQDGSLEEGPRYTGTAGTLGRKVYCTYWIRTGNCNYMQEGCKYKHEIPPDDETRLAIGVRTYPTWPREDPVSNPRPPAIKMPQGLKPALQQQSWRRQEVPRPQDELAGAQKPSHRAIAHHVSAPQPKVNHAPPSLAPKALASRPHQPIQSVSPLQQKFTKPPQNLPPFANHMNQHDSSTQDGASVHKTGDRHHQRSAPAVAGYHNGQSTQPVPQQPYNQGNGVTAHSHQRSPVSQSPLGRRTYTAPTSVVEQQAIPPVQNVVNPFKQRVVTPNPTPQKKVNQQSASGPPTYQIMQKPRTQPGPPPVGFDFGTTSFPGTTPSSANANRSTVPPPYMPTYISNKQSTNAVRSSPAQVHHQLNAQFDGNVDDRHNGKSTATNNESANGQAATSAAHNGTHPASSTSRVDTPTSSVSNIQAPSHDEAHRHHTLRASNSSSDRANTPIGTAKQSSGQLDGNASPFSGTSNPAAITVENQAPLNVKGRGSVLFQGNKHAESAGNATPHDGNYQRYSHLENSASLPFSPPPNHRRMFREPGEDEYVSNPLEEAHGKAQRTVKKHVVGTSSGKARPYPGKNPQPMKKRVHGSSNASSRTHGEDLLA